MSPFTVDLGIRPCVHERCGRRVFDAQWIKEKGAPVALVLDAEPKTWADGARYKIKLTGAVAVTVLKLTTARQAFGGPRLYVEHAEVCEAAPRRKGAKKGDGHA